MYARSFEKDRRPIQIPEHYSGSLFADRHAQNRSERVPPSVQETQPPFRAEVPPPSGAKEERKSEHSEHGLPSAEIQETVQKVVGKLCGGLGFDRLLILGLMLLLSGVDGGSELILWLALLLFV